MDDFKMENAVNKVLNYTLGPNAIVYPNVIIADGAVIGANTLIGYTENPDPNMVTIIGAGVKIRSGAVIYAGCEIGAGSSIGHNSILRENTKIGKNTYLGALVATEGEITIGDFCGINAQCHITRYSSIADYVFFGPGVMSMNDNRMAHKREGHGQNMLGFTADYGVRVGGGSTLLPGVVLGKGCVVGAGSLVTRNVPMYTLVKGRPARVIDEKSSKVDLGSFIKK